MKRGEEEAGKEDKMVTTLDMFSRLSSCSSSHFVLREGCCWLNNYRASSVRNSRIAAQKARKSALPRHLIPEFPKLLQDPVESNGRPCLQPVLRKRKKRRAIENSACASQSCAVTWSQLEKRGKTATSLHARAFGTRLHIDAVDQLVNLRALSNGLNQWSATEQGATALGRPRWA